GSTTVFTNVASVRQRNWRDQTQYGYGLYGTPTTKRLERKLALLEDGRHCLLLPSGLGAISLLLLALLESDERVLLPDNIYEPAADVARLLQDKFNIELAFYDPLRPFDIEFTANTRLLWVETPGSVSMEVVDLPALAKQAHDHGALVAVDATWAAAIALPVFDLGADVSLQALTKYQSGGSDVMMGSLVTRDSELYYRLLATHMRLGFGVSPEDCNLVLRSLPHYKLRYQTQDASARKIAAWLAQQPAVAAVLHPALENAAGHDIWQRDFSGAASLFSIILQPGFSQAQTDACIDSLQLFRIGYGWGGSCSLVMPYDLQSTRRNWTHRGQLIRLYIGLEETDDLIADLAQALSTLKD
ncbi:MAG TPA: PLP-dependent transferase, partial [Methylophilaceae bacterium]|nr:PLP-dependent transferase [Methylophilaceae bacterium]